MESDEVIPRKVEKLLKKQGYHFSGSHSAAKLCGWLKKSLHDDGVCYKQKFYGIDSHRCLQCTPAVAWCTQRCMFCWRFLGLDLGQEIEGEVDDPKDIVDGLIEAQRQMLTGFKSDTDVNREKLEEAKAPKQVAISLSGEPTIYPKLSSLLKEFHDRNMTTFLVSNGTFPERIKELSELPTQMYVTLAAPDKETYEKTCRPVTDDGWRKLNQTLDLISDLGTRTVIRLTLVKGLNMKNPEEYAKLIQKANPDFVEAKGFMSVGFARERLPYDYMPTHDEVKQFAGRLSEHLDMPLVAEQEESRVCLLTNREETKISGE